MGGDDDVVVVLGVGDEGGLAHVGAPFIVEDVGAEGGDVAGIERGDEGGFVDDVAAAGVDEDGAGLHLRDGVGVKQVDVFGQKMDVDGDRVGFAQEGVEVDGLDAADLEWLGIAAEDAHAEGFAVLDGHFAEATDAEDAERAIGKLAAGVWADVPAAGEGVVDGAAQVSMAGEHQHPGALGGGGEGVEQGVVAGDTEDADATLLGLGFIDVIGAGGGGVDDLQSRSAPEHGGVGASFGVQPEGVVPVDDVDKEILIGRVAVDIGDVAEGGERFGGHGEVDHAENSGPGHGGFLRAGELGRGRRASARPTRGILKRRGDRASFPFDRVVHDNLHDDAEQQYTRDQYRK